jgi:hypothetical protein
MNEMINRSVLKGMLLLAILLIIPLQISCIGEKEGIARQKLELILPDDMKAIVEGVQADALMEKPHYTITSYKTYKKGIYSAKAEVDFYFLKKVGVKIVRKFRYHRSKKMWERYFNEYKYTSEAADNK